MKAPTILLHPHYESARSTLLKKLDDAKPGDIFFLLGPSGSGKTEICFDVMCSLAGDFNMWGVGRLPIVYLLATQADKNLFSPKHFMSRLYGSACHPNLEWIVPRGESKSPDIIELENEISAASRLWKLTQQPKTEMDLRDAFIDIAPVRDIRYVFVDDGRALTVTRRSLHPATHLLSYMTLAAEARVVLCLVGTHVLTQLSDPMAEPSRRTKDIFVERYRNDSKEQRTLLASVCTNVATRLQLVFDPPDLLIKSIGLIDVATGGVYAYIQSLLSDAEFERERSGQPAITGEHLESAIPREGKLISRWADISGFDRLREPVNLASVKMSIAELSRAP